MAPKTLANRVSGPKKNKEDIIKEYKENNDALAKKLSHWKTNYNLVLQERNQLQKENMEVLVLNKNLENKLKSIVIWARGLLDCIVKGSEFTTNIICHADLDQLALLASQNEARNETIVETTQAVKKRQSGHNIQIPTIQLTRFSVDAYANARKGAEQDLEADSSTTSPVDDLSGEDETVKEEEVQSDKEEGELDEDDDEVEEDDDDDKVEEEEDNINESRKNISLKRLNTLIEEDTILNSTSNTTVEKTAVLSGIFNDVRVIITPFDIDKSGHLKRKSALSPTMTSPKMVTKRSRKNKVSLRNSLRTSSRIDARAKGSPDTAVSSSSSNSSSIDDNETPNLSTFIDNLSDNLDTEQASVSVTKNSLRLSNGSRTLLSPGFSQRKSQLMTTSTPFNSKTSVYDTTNDKTLPVTPVKHTRKMVPRKKINHLESIPSPPSTRRQARTAKPKSLKEVSLRKKLRRS